MSALNRRKGMGFPNSDTEAYRVVDGGGDGLEGLFIDSWAGHWLVQTQNRPWPDWLSSQAPRCGWRSLWWKRLEQHEKQSPVCMAGDPALTAFRVRELGLICQADFQAGYSQGLFIDQREQKARVAALAQPGQRVLNLFAYTCVFSVVAARGGAVTTSVDLSRPFLDWGRQHFVLNGLDPAAHFFCRGDVAGWLERFAAKDRVWDGIVLDPPTFSRNGDGGVFRVEKDLASLVAACLRVLSPGGWLLASTNHRGMNRAQFTGHLHSGAAQAGRKISGIQYGKMPPDFTGPAYLKAAFISV